jgi:dTDP-4-amino-4,6-dideoxygalactose transaminase
LAAFSFHETKNIISGEGGMIAINDEKYSKRAEIIWEKGTNRVEFFKGEVNKYEWVDTGSSFLPSEITAAFLWAQIENLEKIQKKRLRHWRYYDAQLRVWAVNHNIKPMLIPNGATNNAHMFYLVCESSEQRSALISHLKKEGVLAVFHYISLHSSSYYREKHDNRVLINSDKFTDRLLRLPMYYELDVQTVVNKIKKYI